MMSPRTFEKALQRARVGDSQKVLAQHVELASSRIMHPVNRFISWRKEALAIRQAKDALDQLSTIEQVPATTRLAALEAARKLTDGSSSPLSIAASDDLYRIKKMQVDLQAIDLEVRGFSAGTTEQQIAVLRRQAADEERILTEVQNELGDGYVDQIGRASAHAS